MFRTKLRKFIAVILFAAAILVFCRIKIGNTEIGIFDRILDLTNIQTFSDNKYRESIIKQSQEPSYSIKKLKPIVGPDELKRFIKKNNHNPQIYTPSDENRNNGTFRANLHTHTINSDGNISVEEMLEKALEYAKTLPDKEKFYIAITDHNTVLGAQDIIRVLENKPEGYYAKLKIVPGIEIFTDYINKETNEKETEIHVLTWCINPFDKFLNKEFYKADLNDKYNFKDRSFEDVIQMMKKYGIVGVAHPARYSFYLDERRNSYVPEMLKRYIESGKSAKIFFVEGYYQSYPDEEGFKDYVQFINRETEKYNIMKTGSTDTHGESIFTN